MIWGNKKEGSIQTIHNKYHFCTINTHAHCLDADEAANICA